MTFTDDDLRTALEPLAGDPIQDATNVVAALSKPRGLPLGPIVGAVAAAAALVVGYLLGASSEPAELGPQRPRYLARPDLPQLRAAVGPLQVVTDNGPIEVPTDGSIEFDQFLVTGKSTAAIRLRPGVDVRLASDTKFNVFNEKTVHVVHGRICVQVAEGERLVVDTIEGAIHVAAGIVVVSIAAPEHAHVATLDGEAEFVGISGDAIALAPNQWCESSRGLIKDGWGFDAADLIGWQVPLLHIVDDYAALIPSLLPLVDQLSGTSPKVAKDAEICLRKLGQLGVWTLVDAWHDARMQARLHNQGRTVELLCQIATYENYAELLGQIRLCPSPELRLLRVKAVERLTGIPSERSDEFWESEAPSPRADALDAWRKRIGKY